MSYTRWKQLLNSLVQVHYVQSACWSVRRLRSSGGIVSWKYGAVETWERKLGKLLRDIASVIEFNCPGVCTECTTSWKCALIKNKHRRRCIICVTRLYPELMAATAAVLSQWNVTGEHCHWDPQTAQASTIGSNSFTAMLDSCSSAHVPLDGHQSWSHLYIAGYIALHPNNPEESVHTWFEACFGLRGIIEVPFHLEIKVAHHMKSDLIARLRWTWWWVFWTPKPYQ